MRGSPYLVVMRNAPRLLFAIAALIFVTSLIGDVLGLTIPSPSDPAYERLDKTAKLLSAAANAFYSAAFPLFGAGFLYRLDQFLDQKS
jgi:hypothetical protein